MGLFDKLRAKATAARATDPVCEMSIDPATAAGRSEHAGTTYYFCSLGCKAAFEGDPHAYLGPHAH